MIHPELAFPIGHKFTIKRKDRTEDHEVIDHLTTTNSAGEVVKFRYMTRRMLMGQPVIDRDVPHATVCRNTFDDEGEEGNALV